MLLVLKLHDLLDAFSNMGITIAVSCGIFSLQAGQRDGIFKMQNTVLKIRSMGRYCTVGSRWRNDDRFLKEMAVP